MFEKMAKQRQEQEAAEKAQAGGEADRSREQGVSPLQEKPERSSVPIRSDGDRGKNLFQKLKQERLQ